ncbi:MAG: hypothetical protein HKN11_18540 [Rhizobiales bacterium]|nr:hypothetical protein [Hyphomicrobiales bacterium]
MWKDDLMNRLTPTCFSAAVAAATMLTMSAASTTVMATPLLHLTVPHLAPATDAQEARHRTRRRAERRYRRHLHGKRYRNRHGRHRHRHNGWYYAVPWWLGATLTLPLTQHRYSDRAAHADWCDHKYRSYSRRTDQFLGYDGAYHYCNSPYDNR